MKRLCLVALILALAGCAGGRLDQAIQRVCERQGCTCPNEPTPCPTPTPGPTPIPTPRPTPRPTPTPTPTPIPTPTPTPIPTPTPTPTPPPSGCTKITAPVTCTETTVFDYYTVVRDNLSRIVGGRSEVEYLLDQQEKITVQLMTDLNAQGYCTSYDLQAGQDAEAHNSEMGVRLSSNPSKTEWYQIFATAGHIRWDGMGRSYCTPPADEEQVAEVAAFWHESLPAPGSYVCLLPWGPGRWVEAAIENIGNPPTSQLVSVSDKWCSEVDDWRDPNTGNLAPPGWPYACGTKCCRIGAHEGNLGLACESSLFGIPTWIALDSTVRLVAQDNPFNTKVAEGEGNIQTCGSVTQPAGGLACDTALVRAQPGPVIE